MATTETEYDVEAAAACTPMPYGPYREQLLSTVPTAHLAELLREPFVPVVNHLGDPIQVPAEWLSPFGGAMGKIRRCSCFGLVSDLVRVRDPDTWGAIMSPDVVDPVPEPEPEPEPAAAAKRQRRTRRKAT